MRKIEPEFITGMGYIGASPGVLYHMGGAGEQKVVTGNPALLENVKGSRFTSLTLHGKSTQGSTTGAQLFDVSEVLDETALGTEKPVVGNAVGYWTSGYIPVKTGNYICSSKGTSRGWTYDADKNGLRYINNPGGSPIPIKEGEAFVRVSGKYTDDPQNFMFNEGNSIKPYEPYTGGKPSPSPEYPQEIKSAGQSGEIGVTVTGTNLLPFEVGQKGNGFETFADGVQVDVGRNVDIYAVGRSNSNVESGYDEFALMTAGKYYIYSDIQGVNLYVVVWRKGTNVTLGYSTGGVAKEIEVMDGDKFRIFLRTVKAFKGKVKAMITRIPVNATSYEPYKPAQTLIIPTPNGLPGIRVSSGGNYTDEKGQQWVCDEVDFKKGVYVQRIGKKTISKDSFFKSGLSTDDVNYFGLNNFFVHIGTRGEKDVLMSNCFVAGIYQNFGALGKIFLGSASGNVIYFSVDAQKYPDTETFKQWAAENGLMFLYQLADIVETHLTAEELSAYKTLRTYSPTTTVINDAEAGMSVGYKRRK